MNRYVAMLVVLAFACSVAFAEDKAASDAKEITLKGKIEKKEKKDAVKYVIVTADGTEKLPEKTGDIRLDDYVGAEVEMVVKAVEKEKKGKKQLKVTEIVSVKKVEAAKAPEAAAPKAEEKK